MSNYEVGSIVEGKVTGIKPFGAFVAIDEQKQGLVHISEVAHGFVKDINDVLSVGDEVKVKIMNVEENSGKISLSIRATQEAPERPARPAKPRNTGGGQGGRKPQQQNKPQQGFNTLEDKLKEWLKQSNEIQADLNKRAKK
ncbi:general stress protein 13 putative RNA binding protein [Alkalihalophilus pseudofirmus OF4]|jgi:general stress protein 13|uniref:S1 domain-containing post-transcriptional regulator GSP13 n=3 Tax=Alkalihalophilus TaxID=2893060 RepID=A0AAJ2NPN3_ALKPS|nr:MULTISPECIES: S1 domain-containing post-transcriptional regulator GSP13 [Alkalihalophilus]ADC48985.1 general stress protein 13 putative RNA binding protein [Alkalihalophilus pseudofirmus OF4]ERN52176.1 general stress protein [Alkalihalophilus marmarensis DSM 21297]MCM3491070.1 S1 domain-containing post-transcriptional regulator GSP13 [Alkalihalophilus marmarensis]MDV2886091.1 S1 domain-containing post-transcriptional regulator GSP13 [Alkalihalophilus pseudofirmus]MED1600111.1 S1 domain-cont